MTRVAFLLALLFSPIWAFAQNTETEPKQEPQAEDGAPQENQAAPETDTTPPEAEDTAEAEPSMTLARLDEIVRALDPKAQTNGTAWQFQIAEVPILIITDPTADRMRAMARVKPASEVSPEQMLRMMQANFDTALDARYAIARGFLWSTFIHPLRPLEKDQLISGLGQVANLQQSFGTLYSGGAIHFGGGDSGELQRKLIDELLKKGEEI
ncbi:MAG: hypothetical protein AAGK67_14735 [Pseudomonadota bacterium]